MDKRYIAYMWKSQKHYDDLNILFTTWATLIRIGITKPIDRTIAVQSNKMDHGGAFHEL